MKDKVIVVMKKILKSFIKRIGTIIAPFFSKKSVLDVETARQILMDCSPKPSGIPIAKNEVMEPICDLQIIIPAYNVEAYLNDCIQSILSQETKYTYKIILIDDGSTDGTPDIADKYLLDGRVTVIHQENAGLSGARNAGLKKLFGKYIMFVDSDDMLCPKAIDALLDAAFENDCDIVEGGAYRLKGSIQKIAFGYPKNEQINTALGVLHGQTWGKVYKTECFESVVFPEGFWFEDSVLSFLVYPRKKNVCVIEHMVYIYRDNATGIVATYRGKPKSIETFWVTELLMETRQNLNFVNDVDFFEMCTRQLILNYKRLSSMPVLIQESAFVLSCEIMTRYFEVEVMAKSKSALIRNALMNRDWGIYKMRCMTHFF